MSTCLYCRQSVGLFKKYHQECKDKYDSGFRAMIDITAKAAYDGKEMDDLINTISNIAKNNFLPPEKIRESICFGFSSALNKSLEDGILTEEEEKALSRYIQKFTLSQDELDKYDQSYTKMFKAIAIRQILNGIVPTIFKVQGAIPIILQKNESLVWQFNDVSFLEMRTRTHYEGRTQGVSVRIAKGLYYRTGAFKGNPIQSTSLVLLDRGTVYVTNKNFYFSGPIKKFCIKYSDVMEFSPFDDGIGITKKTASAKLQIFQIPDGWFANNLISNLARL